MHVLTTLGSVFGPIGIVELIVIAFIALLIFGKRLPEVGRSVGKGIVEFKKGLAGIDEDVTKAGAPAAPALPAAPAEPRQLAATSAPKTIASDTDLQLQEQLRATQEQIRQLHEELRAAKEQMAQAQKK